MTSIFRAGYGEINEFVGHLSLAGMNLERLRLVNEDASLAAYMVRAFEEGICENAKKAITNPFALPAETLLERLRQANRTQGWGIKRKDIDALAQTAPALPEGRLAFLSLRIRFGEGQKGVEETANAHIAEILGVHGECNIWRWDYLRTDKRHLRLLAGNETHKPSLEWCVIDLDTHRKRQSITAVRGPKSIADEGLALSWLYPEYIRTIDYKENPGFFLGGYELNIPEYDGSWGRVPIVERHLAIGVVCLDASWRSDDYSYDSVPSLRE